jgi:hypothetical protein
VIDVEPRLREELERWQPLTEVPLRWDDVLARAGEEGASHRRLRLPRRRVVVVAVAAFALVAGGTAYAIARQLFIGDPAPPAVKEAAAGAALLDEVKGELIPRVHHESETPAIRVEQTRLAAWINASTGPVYLWVAPSDRGQCLFMQVVDTEQPGGRPNLSSEGCGPDRLPIRWGVSGQRMRDGQWLTLVSGRVRAPIARLEASYDGRTLAVPLSGRFFLSELPGISAHDVPAIELVGYDAAGRKVARERYTPRAPLPDLDVSGEKPVLEILTRRTRRPLRLYVMERGGRRCTVLAGPGEMSSGGCGGQPPAPREIAVSEAQIGSAPNGMLLLLGEVGGEIERLELRFEDGRVERLPFAAQHTLYQVDARDFPAGRRPIALIGRNSRGEVIAEQEVGPWQR